VGDCALVVQQLGHRERARAARDHDALALLERSARHQDLVAEEDRAADQGDEQRDEEEHPTEIAEHDSASGVQTGPTINEALVPPKPNEFERAYRTLRCLACLATRSMSQPSS